jgi:CubicO group peptidase (beta-lactamase class C family)
VHCDRIHRSAAEHCGRCPVSHGSGRDLYTGALQHGEGVGFGLTVEVVLDSVASGRRVSNGTFGWAGAYGSDFWVDRREQLVRLVMVQQRMPTLILDLENAVMQAIVD